MSENVDIITGPAVDENDLANSGDERYAGPGWDYSTRIDDLQALLKPGGEGLLHYATPDATDSRSVREHVDSSEYHVSKTYIDESDALYLPLAGGTMTGNLLMGANGIGNNASVLTFDVAGNATFSGFLTISGGAGAFGVPDTTPGVLSLYGGAGGAAIGGQVSFHTSADHDAVINAYVLYANEDDLRISQQATVKLTLQGSDGTWLFGAAVGMGGNSITGLSTTGQVQFDANNHISQAVTGTIDYTAATLHNFTANVAAPNFHVPDGGFTGYSGGPGWTYDNTNSIVEATGGDVMLGDAKKLYFEYSGTTKGTEYINSAINNNIVYWASGNHRFVRGANSSLNYTYLNGGQSIFTYHNDGSSGLALNFVSTSWGGIDVTGIGVWAEGLNWSGQYAQTILSSGSYTGRQFILGPLRGQNLDYGHAVQTNPTFFVHGANSPATNPTEWWSVTHNQTNAVMTVGAGDLDIACPAQKTLELQTSVWEDLNFGAGQSQKPSANIPDTVTFTDNVGADTGIATLGYAVGEELSYSTELKHKVKTATDLLPHIHFQCDAAPTGTEYVKWQFDYTITRDGATCAPVTSIVIEVAIDTQYEQYRGDFPAISGTSLLIGDQIKGQLTRIAAAGTEYVGDAKIVTFGVHVEVDTIGSRQALVK